ncbi:hypothetical protein C2G38_2142653 [Gigaspora rosea]|uniref:Helicase C-terminal domain-containing protein n=1 Tax=Gigaspora rosea TaxID=44941 RepID=A0A397VDF6_9GLOM|nr:hypothetical protein C2G38_2142653 [Gigaspora rosea]
MWRPSAVPLIKFICQCINEDIEEVNCVVTFSKKSIFSLKYEIEAATDFCCCVAYGGLPPGVCEYNVYKLLFINGGALINIENLYLETRSQLFNDPNSGFDVLVASDAVGMGWNL